MSTVREVLDEFLEEQRARLGPGMYMYYERTVMLLEAYMDRNPMHFIRHTGVPPERPSRGRTATCCDTLGPDVIDARLLLDFLHSHMVREVRCGRTLMRMAITVTRRPHLPVEAGCRRGQRRGLSFAGHGADPERDRLAGAAYYPKPRALEVPRQST